MNKDNIIQGLIKGICFVGGYIAVKLILFS
jgi:hypothetical protein